jgi:anti-sigma B factor antagonist
MEITSTSHGEVTVISLAGELDVSTSPDATAYLSAEVEGGRTNLVIDIGGVTYLSSAGLRAILGATREARSAGGDARLAGAEGDVERVTDMAGFGKIMKIFSTVEEALESYGL